MSSIQLQLNKVKCDPIDSKNMGGPVPIPNKVCDRIGWENNI